MRTAAFKVDTVKDALAILREEKHKPSRVARRIQLLRETLDFLIEAKALREEGVPSIMIERYLIKKVADQI